MSMPIHLVLQHVFKISVISMQTCFESCTPLVNGYVDDMLFNAAYDVMSNDVEGTWKRHLS